MIEKIISAVIGFLIPILLGYCLGYIKKKRKNETVQNQALVMMLQNNLTNTYFVYEQIGEIPDYVYKNWLNLLKAYEGLEGDDYIHCLADKMKKWKIVKTDILLNR
ncbi:MAG: hypothetical protein II393_04065 [Cytophagales bacterium]|nr:hypothetical protein [Cytophagales bacterium]